MGRTERSHALTIDRFASGKDGRANAFKKKKQGEQVGLKWHLNDFAVCKQFFLLVKELNT